MIREELARAFLENFGLRGGAFPDAIDQIVPVVVMDDLSRGPFPPSRVWTAGQSVPAVVASLSFCGIANNDTPGSGSICVVDRIVARPLVAAEFELGVIAGTAFNWTAQIAVSDAAQDKDPGGPSTEPKLGNLRFGYYNTGAVNLVNTVYPCGDTLPKIIEGPWTIGPAEVLLIAPAAVNVGIVAFFRGRYYPAG